MRGPLANELAPGGSRTMSKHPQPRSGVTRRRPASFFRNVCAHHPVATPISIPKLRLDRFVLEKLFKIREGDLTLAPLVHPFNSPAGNMFPAYGECMICIALIEIPWCSQLRSLAAVFCLDQACMQFATAYLSAGWKETETSQLNGMEERAHHAEPTRISLLVKHQRVAKPTAYFNVQQQLW